jgi:hypothetical protein
MQRGSLVSVRAIDQLRSNLVAIFVKGFNTDSIRLIPPRIDSARVDWIIEAALPDIGVCAEVAKLLGIADIDKPVTGSGWILSVQVISQL